VEKRLYMIAMRGVQACGQQHFNRLSDELSLPITKELVRLRVHLGDAAIPARNNQALAGSF
jgi:hypothetical protein